MPGLVMMDRERAGREASLSAAIMEANPSKSPRPAAHDAKKKINGRKRHALVDTDGRPLLVEPHPADIQDRDTGEPLLQISRPSAPLHQTCMGRWRL